MDLHMIRNYPYRKSRCNIQSWIEVTVSSAKDELWHDQMQIEGVPHAMISGAIEICNLNYNHNLLVAKRSFQLLQDLLLESST